MPPEETFDAELDAAAESHPFPTPVAQQIVDEAHAELAHQDAPGGDGSGPPAGATLPPGFSPSIHTWPPQKTTRGTWRLKRGTSAAALNPEDVDPNAPPDPLTAAENWSASLFATAEQALGPAWAPEEPQRVEVRRCLGRVFVAHGAVDLPPVPALLLAVAMYALPRLFLPETRQKLGELVALVTGARAEPNPVAVAQGAPPVVAQPAARPIAPAADEPPPAFTPKPRRGGRR